MLCRDPQFCWELWAGFGICRQSQGLELDPGLTLGPCCPEGAPWGLHGPSLGTPYPPGAPGPFLQRGVEEESGTFALSGSSGPWGY